MKVNRRNFIVSSAAATAGLTAGCASVTPRDRSWIDAHVHVWTPDTRRYPLAAGYARKDMVPGSFTPEELFLLSRPEGVTRTVLIQMSFYQYDNRYMLDTMKRFPGVFGGVAIIDENEPDVRGRMKRLAEQGVRGFRLYAFRKNTSGWASSSGMREMWRVGAEAGLAMCCLTDPDALPDITRMCRDHPETPVVIDHFARIGMRGAADPNQLDQLLALSKYRRTHVKTSAFYALGKKQPPYADLGPMIRRLRDSFGAERLMWATDCPYQASAPHTYADSIALIRDRLEFLSASDRQWMLRGTAEKLFFA